MKVLLINTILFALILSGCDNLKAPPLNCNSIVTLEKKNSRNFNSESVTIRSVVLKEEVYFKKINCIYVTIVDPVLDCLNIRGRADSSEIKDYKKMENEIKNESLESAHMLIKNCHIASMSDIIFEYGKNNDEGYFIPWFTIHFSELIEKH